MQTLTDIDLRHDPEAAHYVKHEVVTVASPPRPEN